MITRRNALKALAVSPLALTATAQRDALLRAVDDERDLKLLRKMIQTKSYSGSGEESTLARLMVEQMDALGLETELIEVEPGRFDAVGRLPGTLAGRASC